MIRTACGKVSESLRLCVASNPKSTTKNIQGTCRETRTSAQSSGEGKSSIRSCERRVPKKHAFAATPFEDPAEVGDISGEDDEYDGSDREQQEDAVDCCACVTCLVQDEYDCVGDQLEQDVVTCFDAAGADMNHPSTAEDISSCVHDELFGFSSRERASSSFRPKASTQLLAEVRGQR